MKLSVPLQAPENPGANAGADDKEVSVCHRRNKSHRIEDSEFQMGVFCRDQEFAAFVVRHEQTNDSLITLIDERNIHTAGVMLDGFNFRTDLED
ncbi:MAG: hypothetical protein ABI945_05380 [Nitrospirales bacterium]